MLESGDLGVEGSNSSENVGRVGFVIEARDPMGSWRNDFKGSRELGLTIVEEETGVVEARFIDEEIVFTWLGLEERCIPDSLGWKSPVLVVAIM